MSRFLFCCDRGCSDVHVKLVPFVVYRETDLDTGAVIAQRAEPHIVCGKCDANVSVWDEEKQDIVAHVVLDEHPVLPSQEGQHG